MGTALTVSFGKSTYHGIKICFDLGFVLVQFCSHQPKFTMMWAGSLFTHLIFIEESLVNFFLESICVKTELTYLMDVI